MAENLGRELNFLFISKQVDAGRVNIVGACIIKTDPQAVNALLVEARFRLSRDEEGEVIPLPANSDTYAYQNRHCLSLPEIGDNWNGGLPIEDRAALIEQQQKLNNAKVSDTVACVAQVCQLIYDIEDARIVGVTIIPKGKLEKDVARFSRTSIEIRKAIREPDDTQGGLGIIRFLELYNVSALNNDLEVGGKDAQGNNLEEFIIFSWNAPFKIGGAVGSSGRDISALAELAPAGLKSVKTQEEQTDGDIFSDDGMCGIDTRLQQEARGLILKAVKPYLESLSNKNEREKYWRGRKKLGNANLAQICLEQGRIIEGDNTYFTIDENRYGYCSRGIWVQYGGEGKPYYILFNHLIEDKLKKTLEEICSGLPVKSKK